MSNSKNTLTNDLLPHGQNATLFSEVQVSQIKSTQYTSLFTPTYIADSPRDVTQIQNDSNIIAPKIHIRQINDFDWCFGLGNNYGKEFILIQNCMYSDMQLHFIVKDKETQKYKKWYLNVSKEKPIVEEMKFCKKNENDLWEYLKGVKNDWIPYNGGEFSNEEINFARNKN